jgi:TonB family protein
LRRLVRVTRGDPLHIRGAYSLRDARQLPVTGDLHPLKREAARWLGWGAGASLALGLALGTTWGWWSRVDEAVSGHEVRIVREEYKFHPGAYGPLRVERELSIEDGNDARNQLASRAREEPHPPPAHEPLPAAAIGELVPLQPPARGPFTDAREGEDPDLDLTDAVEMHMPAQLNPCFVLERLVRPEYPLEADAQARCLGQITVEAAFYVDESGLVTGAYVLRSSGLPLFDNVVLRAVSQWRFKPVSDPQCPPLGFWVRLPVLFRSPHRLLRH